MSTLDENAAIAQSLYAAEESLRYDAACKRVLSEKAILARIMKSCLEEYRDCDPNEIAQRYIEGQPQVSSLPVLPDGPSPLIRGLDTEDKSPYEGAVTYDILFRAIVPGSGESIGLIVNMEAQNDFYPGYPLVKRGIYYCCRMISSQYGREFTSSHYEKLKKVYSIWICMNPPGRRKNSIIRYRLAEEPLVGESAEPPRNYDMLSIILLCLGGPESENYGGILRMLDVLFSQDTSAVQKRKILQDDYGIHMTQRLETEVSSMCNFSKGVIDKSLAQGLEKGLAQGLERGLEKGILESTLSSIQNLMETLGLSAAQAMAALKVPEPERQKYMDLLARQ